MTRAMSIWLAQGASSSTVVPGLMAKPTCETQVVLVLRHEAQSLQLIHVCTLAAANTSQHQFREIAMRVSLRIYIGYKKIGKSGVLLCAH